MNEFVQAFPQTWQEKWQNKVFSEPSLIQKLAFNALKEKESMVGISPTGSGKTLAYLLPLLLNVSKGEGHSLLILVSSQELAIQVAEVTREWAKELALNVQSLVGGANVKRQIEGLKKHPEILVGTPGRVLELMKTKKLKAHQLQTIVFDEADQLLDDGNRKLVVQILHQAPVDYQLVFFSATADRSIDKINEITNAKIPIVDVTKEDNSTKGQKHYFLRVPSRKKEEYLRRLTHVDGFHGLVFFNQLSELGMMEEKLQFRGVSVGSLASDQNKVVRKAALEQFKNKKLTALFTTDVAARGLDIHQLPYVVNAEVPLTEESYLHRSGRTGRMGKDGMVITFVQENTIRDLKRLTRNMTVEIEEIFLHSGQLVTALPEKEELAIEKKQHKNAPFVPSKKEKKTAEKDKLLKKKSKNKQKKQKNKGARRK
ncbi:DEAD/DEAH box helicase [Enterococcus villorum]|uniref:DEAD/DEAH box helicase n=1 Tax=Enterococcus villorum TaxID=112904 RepID=UPI0009BDE99B|nr:DEAD/DEAH box helicase [Enterococcus villorum]OQO76837.1 RNA helicase [Enterococcus villorum]